MPCSEKRARLLLERGRARVHRLMPFTIRLVDRMQEDSVLQPLRVKLDPGSKTTGIELVRDSEDVDADTGEVKKAAHAVFLADHALDAACVGDVDAVEGWQQPVLQIKATGRGSYQRTRLTKHGFPRGYLTRSKRVQGFQTGDRVRAVVPSGKKAGTHTGRVAVRAAGSFNLQTPQGVVQGIHHRHCTLIQRADGYGYSWTKIA